MSTSSKNKNSVSIGYVSAAHGVKGEVRIVPLTDFPERFGRMDSLDLYSDGQFVRTLRVARIREHESKGELIVESDVTARNEAEKLVGTSVLIDPEDRTPLPEDAFWIDDLIGLTVQDRAGNLLGKVTDFISAGGNEVYEVEDEKGKRHYIPAVENFIKEIDLASGKIVVELIEGMWE
jgi:16S rRNA processing protein RimM